MAVSQWLWPALKARGFQPRRPESIETRALAPEGHGALLLWFIMRWLLDRAGPLSP
jgi:hypothetical protein